MQYWINKVKSMTLALGVAVVAFAGYSAESAATACPTQGTYDQLLNTTCTMDDKIFSGFSFGISPAGYLNGNGDPFSAKDVSFTALVNSGGQWGFVFTFLLQVRDGKAADLGIGYTVECVGGAKCLTSLHADLAAQARGGGEATLDESYASTDGTVFGSFTLSPANPSKDLFFAPVSAMRINKDINVDCTAPNVVDCKALISIVTNTVDSSKVPEPGTLALLAGGLLGLGWVGRRRGNRA
ncbi:MAG: PEP-CTERM sorting domain-containing protein [Burkholderiales bacterium]